jgi:coenzyme F420-dependent glucose-6-phosphate dehydrogenase
MSNSKGAMVDADKTELGYSLMSEEHGPNDLVKYAILAEESGFSFATISDHYHPWIDAQGHSPFVWSVVGAVSHATKNLRLGTAVTCPTMRVHPAIIAQAVATSAAMMPGRFFFGVGTGENLNEHILGTCWPAYEVRSAMLEEALEVIRKLWEGKVTSYYGNFFVIENAKIYTLPGKPIPIYVAAGGPKSAKLAGQIGDGLISTSPDKSLVKLFRSESENKDLPCYAQVTVCFNDDEAKARKIAREKWPNAGFSSDLNPDLSTPRLFEQVAELVSEDAVAKSITCGNDVARHLEAIHKYFDAGFSKVMVHNVGSDQEEFFAFYKEKIIPNFKT